MFFIGVKFSANAHEILGDDGNNTLHDCKIINPKVLYSKNNMKTFYNGKNAHHAGAYDTAFRILMPLAEQGHKRAQTGIGLMYLHGNGVEKNESKALEWFKEATCQNHDWAFYHLGTMYYYGMSVEQSYEKSFEYFQKASLINNATAFLNLGHFYQEGKGVQKDDLLALKNYKKALQLGEIDAAFYLGEILLKPTHIYVSEFLSLKKIVNINAISHITGGGFNENVPRMLGKNQQAIIDHNFQDWPFGHYFEWLMKVTNMPKENLLNTFNCGVGLIISVNKSDEENVLGALNQKFFAKTIGEVKERERNDQQIIFV